MESTGLFPDPTGDAHIDLVNQNISAMKIAEFES